MTAKEESTSRSLAESIVSVPDSQSNNNDHDDTQQECSNTPSSRIKRIKKKKKKKKKKSSNKAQQEQRLNQTSEKLTARAVRAIQWSDQRLGRRPAVAINTGITAAAKGVTKAVGWMVGDPHLYQRANVRSLVPVHVMVSARIHRISFIHPSLDPEFSRKKLMNGMRTAVAGGGGLHHKNKGQKSPSATAALASSSSVGVTLDAATTALLAARVEEEQRRLSRDGIIADHIRRKMEEGTFGGVGFSLNVDSPTVNTTRRRRPRAKGIRRIILKRDGNATWGSSSSANALSSSQGQSNTVKSVAKASATKSKKKLKNKLDKSRQSISRKAKQRHSDKQNRHLSKGKSAAYLSPTPFPPSPTTNNSNNNTPTKPSPFLTNDSTNDPTNPDDQVSFTPNLSSYLTYAGTGLSFANLISETHPSVASMGRLLPEIACRVPKSSISLELSRRKSVPHDVSAIKSTQPIVVEAPHVLWGHARDPLFAAVAAEGCPLADKRLHESLEESNWHTANATESLMAMGSTIWVDVPPNPTTTPTFGEQARKNAEKVGGKVRLAAKAGAKLVRSPEERRRRRRESLAASTVKMAVSASGVSASGVSAAAASAAASAAEERASQRGQAEGSLVLKSSTLSSEQRPSMIAEEGEEEEQEVEDVDGTQRRSNQKSSASPQNPPPSTTSMNKPYNEYVQDADPLSTVESWESFGRFDPNCQSCSWEDLSQSQSHPHPQSQPHPQSPPPPLVQSQPQPQPQPQSQSPPPPPLVQSQSQSQPQSKSQSQSLTLTQSLVQPRSNLQPQTQPPIQTNRTQSLPVGLERHNTVRTFNTSSQIAPLSKLQPQPQPQQQPHPQPQVALLEGTPRTSNLLNTPIPTPNDATTPPKSKPEDSLVMVKEEEERSTSSLQAVASSASVEGSIDKPSPEAGPIPSVIGRDTAADAARRNKQEGDEIVPQKLQFRYHPYASDMTDKREKTVFQDEKRSKSMPVKGTTESRKSAKPLVGTQEVLRSTKVREKENPGGSSSKGETTSSSSNWNPSDERVRCGTRSASMPPCSSNPPPPPPSHGGSWDGTASAPPSTAKKKQQVTEGPSRAASYVVGTNRGRWSIDRVKQDAAAAKVEHVQNQESLQQCLDSQGVQQKKEEEEEGDKEEGDGEEHKTEDFTQVGKDYNSVHYVNEGSNTEVTLTEDKNNNNNTFVDTGDKIMDGSIKEEQSSENNNNNDNSNGNTNNLSIPDKTIEEAPSLTLEQSKSFLSLSSSKETDATPATARTSTSATQVSANTSTTTNTTTETKPSRDKEQKRRKSSFHLRVAKTMAKGRFQLGRSLSRTFSSASENRRLSSGENEGKSKVLVEEEDQESGVEQLRVLTSVSTAVESKDAAPPSLEQQPASPPDYRMDTPPEPDKQEQNPTGALSSSKTTPALHESVNVATERNEVVRMVAEDLAAAGMDREALQQWRDNRERERENVYSISQPENAIKGAMVLKEMDRGSVYVPAVVDVSRSSMVKSMPGLSESGGNPTHCDENVSEETREVKLGQDSGIREDGVAHDAGPPYPDGTSSKVHREPSFSSFGVPAEGNTSIHQERQSMVSVDKEIAEDAFHSPEEAEDLNKNQGQIKSLEEVESDNTDQMEHTHDADTTQLDESVHVPTVVNTAKNNPSMTEVLGLSDKDGSNTRYSMVFDRKKQGLTSSLVDTTNETLEIPQDMYNVAVGTGGSSMGHGMNVQNEHGSDARGRDGGIDAVFRSRAVFEDGNSLETGATSEVAEKENHPILSDSSGEIPSQRKRNFDNLDRTPLHQNMTQGDESFRIRSTMGTKPEIETSFDDANSVEAADGHSRGMAKLSIDRRQVSWLQEEEESIRRTVTTSTTSEHPSLAASRSHIPVIRPDGKIIGDVQGDTEENYSDSNSFHSITDRSKQDDEQEPIPQDATPLPPPPPKPLPHVLVLDDVLEFRVVTFPYGDVLATFPVSVAAVLSERTFEERMEDPSQPSEMTVTLVQEPSIVEKRWGVEASVTFRCTEVSSTALTAGKSSESKDKEKHERMDRSFESLRKTLKRTGMSQEDIAEVIETKKKKAAEGIEVDEFDERFPRRRKTIKDRKKDMFYDREDGMVHSFDSEGKLQSSFDEATASLHGSTMSGMRRTAITASNDPVSASMTPERWDKKRFSRLSTASIDSDPLMRLRPETASSTASRPPPVASLNQLDIKIPRENSDSSGSEGEGEKSYHNKQQQHTKTFRRTNVRSRQRESRRRNRSSNKGQSGTSNVLQSVQGFTHGLSRKFSDVGSGPEDAIGIMHKSLLRQQFQDGVSNSDQNFRAAFHKSMRILDSRSSISSIRASPRQSFRAKSAPVGSSRDVVDMRPKNSSKVSMHTSSEHLDNKTSAWKLIRAIMALRRAPKKAGVVVSNVKHGMKFVRNVFMVYPGLALGLFWLVFFLWYGGSIKVTTVDEV